MKKLKLDPEMLVVEAFEVASVGSVEAYEGFTTYGPWLCPVACGYTDEPCDPT
jgi:hypothetical protein